MRLLEKTMEKVWIYLIIICSNPKVIFADEPVASLDVSIKEDIMDVLSFEFNKIFNK